MDCKQFLQILEELQRELPMKGSVRAEGLKHVEHCCSCRARLAEARLLTLELRGLAKHDELLQSPVYLEAQLRAAFREQARRSSFLRRTLGWGIAVAALSLIGWVLAESPRLHSLPAPSAAIKTRVGVPAPVPRSPALQLESKSGGGLRALHKARKTVPKRISLPAEVSAESEAASGFVALPYGDSGYPAGDGMMIRVQLPRSAPAMVGLPMAPGSGVSGPVTADVVIGQDGIARAIRFVMPEESGALPRNVNFNHEINQGERH